MPSPALGSPQDGRANSSDGASSIRLRWAVALSAVSGALYFAAFPGVGGWPLAFVALAPLLAALRGRSPASGAALGLLSGTITTFLGFFWLLDTLRTYSGFPLAVCVSLLLLLSVLQGGRCALFAALSCALSRKRWPWLASVVAAFAVSETCYPLLFPWFLGASLHAQPLLIQSADLGGPVLVGLPLVVIAAVVARAFAPRSSRPATRYTLVIAGATIALPAVYGMLVIPFVDRDVREAPAVRIGFVQGNIPMPPASAQTLYERFRDQVRRSRQLKAEGADLILWPESAFVSVLPEAAPADAISRTEAGSLGLPLLVGALLEHEGPPLKTFNAALMLDSDAKVLGRYDKQHLLPFGEYLPLGEQFPFLYRLSPASGRISPGSRAGPVPFEDKRITVLICYEDILPGFVVNAVRRHQPHLLVNLTNDGWFGRSWEPQVHLALAKFRAVEHRRYLARATNTGQTALIDPVGRVAARAPAFVEASLVAEARWMHGWTLYGMWGDIPWYLVALGSVVGLFVGPKRR
jgi:apolipoprotein N-acyltransferase